MKKWLVLLAFLLCPVTANAQHVGAFVNASPLTITSGGAWQALFPNNTNRTTLWIENPCSTTTQGIGATESLFVAFSTKAPTTTAGAFELAACGSLVMTGTYVNTQPVWIYAATTSHAFAATQTQ